MLRILETLSKSLKLPAGPCILDVLPPELLQLIIAEHLEGCADIQAMSRTCHALHSLTSSPALEAAWLWRWHGDQGLFQTPTISLNLAVLRQLVDVHHADVNAVLGERADVSCCGQALLHLACKADRADIVGYLASAPGVNVNQTFGLDNMTPLHVACRYGSAGAARQLLALPQIQVNAVTSQGVNSLYRACAEQTMEVLEELLRQPDFNIFCTTPLSFAASRGDSEIVALLLRHPAINANAGDRCGTSLHHAVRGRHMEVLQQLLRHPGIQVNALDEFECSSLFTACDLPGAIAIIAELLKHLDIDVNSAEGHGACSLRMLALRGHTAAVALLLQHPDLQVNAADASGNTALFHACSLGHFKTARALLRHPGIDVNAVTAAAQSSLGIACARGDLPVVRELLEHPGWSPGSIRAAFAEAGKWGRQQWWRC